MRTIKVTSFSILESQLLQFNGGLKYLYWLEQYRLFWMLHQTRSSWAPTCLWAAIKGVLFNSLINCLIICLLICFQLYGCLLINIALCRDDAQLLVVSYAHLLCIQWQTDWMKQQLKIYFNLDGISMIKKGAQKNDLWIQHLALLP